MDLIKSSDFQRQCQSYKHSKKIVESGAKFIEKTVKKNTEKEFNEVQRAVKALNHKIKSVMNQPEIKNQKNLIETEQKKMFLSLNKVLQVFNEAKQVIISDNTLSEENKMTYLKSLEEKMIDKLFDEKEKEYFKRMVSNMIIVLPRGGINNALPDSQNPTISQYTRDHKQNKLIRGGIDNRIAERGNINNSWF